MTTILENSFPVIYVVNICSSTMCPSHFILRCLCNRNEILCLHKYLNMNSHSSIIYNSWRLETTQISIDIWLGKTNYNISKNWNTIHNKKQCSSYIHSDVNEFQKCYAVQKLDSKNIYTKMSFLGHSRKGEANQWDKKHIGGF